MSIQTPKAGSVGNQASSHKQPLKGSLANPSKTQPPGGKTQSVQPAKPVPESVLAIYLFEQEDPSNGTFHCVFFDEKRVFVIPTLAISSHIVDTMIKGLTYKLFLGSKDPPSIVIQNLAHYEHALPTKIEVPTIDSYVKAPYFLCKVTVSKGTAQHANFQLLKVGYCNIQIPFNVIPEELALKGKEERTIKVAFTSRNIRTKASASTATRRMPFVESNFFTFCDRFGNDIPAPPATTGKKIIEFFFYREISISYRENSIISRIIENYRVFLILLCKGNADQEIPKKHREFRSLLY